MTREREEQKNLQQSADERIIGYTIGYVSAMHLFESDRGPSNIGEILQELPAQIKSNILNDLKINITLAQYMLIRMAIYDMRIAKGISTAD